MSRPNELITLQWKTVQWVAGIGFWEMHLKDQTLHWSEETFRMIGLTPDTFDGRFETLLRYVHPEDIHLLQEAVRQIYQGNIPAEFEYRILRTDGEVRNILLRGMSLLDKHGERILIGTSQDVTELKIEQRKNSHNQLLLEIAGDAARIGGWSWDIVSNVVEWSEQVYKITGVSPDGPLDLDKAMSYLDDKSRAELLQSVNECVKTGKPYDVVLQTRTPDGRILALRAIGRALRDRNGKTVSLQGAMQDITAQISANAERNRLVKRLASTLGNMTDAFMLLDCDWKVVFINQRMEVLLGRSRASLLGKVVWDELTDLADVYRAKIQFAAREGRSIAFERFIPSRGLWVDVNAVPTDDGVAVYLHDFTARKKAEEANRISQQRFEVIAKATTDIVWDWDLKTNALWWSANAQSAFGLKAEEQNNVIESWTSRIHPDDLDDVRVSLKACWNGGQEIWEDEYRFMMRDGAYGHVWDRGYIFRDEKGTAVRMMGAMVDITERKKAAQKIEHMAYFDALTGLPNRAYIMERLAEALSRGGANSPYGALILLDLDNFKVLNDTLGHHVGDECLCLVGKRLRDCVPVQSVTSRFGGDEFLILAENLGENVDVAMTRAQQVAGTIIEAFQHPFKLQAYNNFYATPSLGVTLFGGADAKADEMLKQADFAMYQAKANGRNNFRFFDPAMQSRMAERSMLESELRIAIRHRQFVAYYQPQVDTDGKIIGAEALVRWKHSRLGLTAPEKFIDIAEESGLMIPIGLQVLETVCRQIADWQRAPATSQLTIAANVSVTQLRHGEFVESVLEVIKRTGANPAMLKLEITESVLVQQVDDTIERMNRLRQVGISFSLDDFGTGYSSFSYLKRLPIDQIKIDRSFVRDVITDPQDATLTAAMISLGKSLGLTIVAEGVETEQQRVFLLGHECPIYQGYLFGKPMPVDEFNALINHSIVGG